jgi:sugar phosphate isomerase/epimerase
MKPAFSTVACPDWTLANVAAKAEGWGYVGCELRTFGYGSRESACEPALTAPAKLRAQLQRAGLAISSLATSIRYDAPISPPVVGLYLDNESMIRETKGCVDLAVQVEAPFVRVFGFELPEFEARKVGVARVVERLIKCADYCRNSGVKLVLENGGSFNTAAQLLEVTDRVNSPLLTIAYSIPVGVAAGDDVGKALNALGERLTMIKVKDLKDGMPVALGEGELNVRAHLSAAASAGFDGWVVYEYDRAWLPGGDDASMERALAASAKVLFEHVGTGSRADYRAVRTMARR